MAHPTHIFVVGCYRSGTTLLRNVLNASPYVKMAGETHFLRYRHNSFSGIRNTIRKMGDLKIESNMLKIVDFLYDRDKSKFWGGDWASC